jgi:hypothetical protein
VPVLLPATGVRAKRDRGIVPWLVSLFSGAPVTVGFVAVFWILALVSSPVFPGAATLRPAYVAVTARSLPEHWWAVVASALWAPDLFGYVLTTLTFVLDGVERTRTIRRTAAKRRRRQTGPRCPELCDGAPWTRQPAAKRTPDYMVAAKRKPDA